MTWQIWLAIASIVFIVFGLVKRLETRMLLIVAGFILCCASGAPMKAFGAFVKGMTNITLVPAICSAMGFAFAVQASKCDQHLVAAVAAPLKKLGGLLIPAATILTFLINIANVGSGHSCNGWCDFYSAFIACRHPTGGSGSGRGGRHNGWFAA